MWPHWWPRQRRPAEIFSAVSNEVATLFGTELVFVGKFDGDPVALLVVGVSEDTDEPVVGSRWKLDDALASAAVYRTGLPARLDRHSTIVDPDVAEIMERLGPTATVAVPIKVEGGIWGTMVVATRDAVLPTDTEERLQRFTDLIATALANAGARAEVERLAEEQAALRRVATLVAQDAAPAEIFAAVSAEVDRVFGLDPATFDVAVVGRFGPGPELVIVGISKSVDVGPLGSRWPPDELFAPTHVFRTGRSARIRAEDVVSASGEVADLLRHHGYLSQVASPIVVDGRLWGAMLVTTRNELPPDTEDRLAQFTELVATALANAESREALAELADEQAALRRVATLVAQGAPPYDVFGAAAEEVARVFTLSPETSDVASVVRFDPGPEFVLVGSSKSIEGIPLESPWQPKDLYASTRVFRTGRSARVDPQELDPADNADAEALRRQRLLSQVGSPIVVDGRLWGAMTINAYEELPADTEERLEKFTELAATAIANSDSRGAIARLADEQAALRRVATLVARDAASTEVFEAVATEVGKLLDADVTVVGRYDGDGSATAIGSWSASPGGVPVGTRSAIGGHNVLTIVAETGKPARVDGYDDASGEAAEIARRYGWRSSIAAPIVVEDRLWGVMLVATQRPELFRAGSEERLAAFTDLVATAVANTQARAEVERLADEQATLRRLATLVARGTEPVTVFRAVCNEAQALLGADLAGILRFHDDRTVTVMANSGGPGQHGVGVRVSFDHGFVVDWVHETHQAARFDTDDPAAADMPKVVQILGVRSAVGSPIVVDGELWGVITLASVDCPLPLGMERRLADFTELVATAIANAESSAELVASRRRIVAASDDARRRIERDLHDGVQQQLVSLGLALGALQADPPSGEALEEQLASVTEDVGSVLDALMETARGIHPAILSQGGLAAALKALARRSAVPVELHAQIEGPLPDDVEVAAYYVAAEALTNAAKHARASLVQLDVTTDDRTLTLTVRDDGVGGADPGGGSGLVGLQDRVEALGGTIKLDSPAGHGTRLTVTLPIATEPDQQTENLLRPPHDLRSPTSPA